MVLRHCMLVYTFSRLHTGPKDWSFASYWMDSLPGSVHREVYNNNMDDSSFHQNSFEALSILLKLPQQAYFGIWEHIYNAEGNIRCKVITTRLNMMFSPMLLA